MQWEGRVQVQYSERQGGRNFTGGDQGGKNWTEGWKKGGAKSSQKKERMYILFGKGKEPIWLLE